MFNRYQGKAIERLAHEVTTLDVIQSTNKESTSVIDLDGEEVEFKHYEQVNVGDFILYIDDDDIYHCSRKVFLDRNHIKGVDLDFGTAVKVMKAGGKVARAGWNGANMFAFLVEGGGAVVSKQAYACVQREYLALKTAQGDVATWAPSGSDTLACDWFIVE